ncbi:Smr domain-containing protein [Algoriphagus ratkowskyi]|uniref:DNA mismatch repair protein MutS n=1 Tax=Algoriphagus ratkowskyi TaxID=57028 RepID=A0A2W7QY49_9BACT|nr:Smr/MutS family protein [Algoriphagus ratkowskyi]PZX53453.1 Smr domain-containing protein [Algoriphagus ratkowskyi]TXD76508.1 DNA mismatch repair protein MutS [Algoriphagus ratkowskyi]
MNIGDRVRLLHGNEEGIIRKISSSGRMQIEIEDGFIIPALKSELVLIHEAEKQYFGEKPVEEKEIDTPIPISGPKDQGLYLAFLPINDQSLSLYLINDSRQPYLAHASEVFGTNQRTLLAATLNPGEAKKFDDRMLKEMDEWPAFLLRFIPIHNTLEKAIPAFERQLKMKPTQFFKHLSKAPRLDKTAYIFHLEQATKELDIRALNQELDEIRPKSESSKAVKPSRSIDLHIEKLATDPKGMSNSEMLRVQLESFERNLDQAMASGMDEITFIHGIGNGVLRKEIHKRLSQLQNIKYFQDTQKDQWGYGATLVRIS